MRDLNKLYWPYKVVLPKVKTYVTDIDPREEWGIKQFTKRNFKAIGFNPVTFHFRNEVDAVYFSLRWK